jgi:hypothetical protein
VAHVYNPSYSRGRDQEDHDSKPAQENSSRDPILKKHKKCWQSGSRCRLQVQTPVLPKKKAYAYSKYQKQNKEKTCWLSLGREKYTRTHHFNLWAFVMDGLICIVAL